VTRSAKMPCFDDFDPKYEYMNLANRNMSYDDINDFLSDMSGDGMLLQLDLSDNISLQMADNPDEMEKLTKTLCLCLEHNQTMLAFEFANNNLGYYGPYPLSLHAVDYFKDVIKSLPKSTVRRLDISGNYILGPSNKILSTWALLLKMYCKKQCEVLRARNNGISSPAISLLGSILGPDAIIEELDLNDNMAGLDAFGNVNSEGIYSFTRVLGMSPKLCILKLARNHLHDQDAIFLSECLCAMPGLQELDLAGNFIGPHGMVALKLFIVGHCNLTDMQGIKKLNLGSNPLGSDGLFILNDAMFLNNTITDLDISDCGFRSTALFGLKTALQNNSTLLKLQTHTNRVTKDAQEVAHAEVEANNFVRSIIRNRGKINAKKLRLSSKNALALKLRHIPKDILLVLHDNANLNETESLFQDELYVLCPPSRTKLIKRVEGEDDTMHNRIEKALALDRINHAKQKIFHFIVRNVKRKMFSRMLFGAIHVQRLENAAEESAMHKRARDLELNGRKGE